MYGNTTGPNSTYSQQFQWVKDQGFQAPADATDGTFQRARGIVGTPTFQYWAKDDPTSLSQLSVWMSSQQRHRLNWHNWFPVDIFLKEDIGQDTVFLVDVGGGLGHDLAAFAASMPDQQMRLVNEDLPEVINEARKLSMDGRIELLEHDFFQAQPIKGAKIVSAHFDNKRNAPKLMSLFFSSITSIRYSTIGRTKTVSKFLRSFETPCQPGPESSLTMLSCPTRSARCCKPFLVRCSPSLLLMTDLGRSNV
jgi:hypothetical protein